MEAAKRREYIVSKLAASKRPVSATVLANELSVSRQIIVGDIALLRAAGEKIMATPRGYLLDGLQGENVYTVACVHGVDDMEKELNIMVDNGCTVLNVTVEHPIYGQLTGQLHLSNRYEVSQFMRKIGGNASPLSGLTGGIHLHALACPDRECFERTKEQLAREGLLYTQSH